MMEHTRLVFLKLGGSLITDKTTPMTPRPDVIQRLANELSCLMKDTPELRLLIGHGSGSFGHEAADHHHTHMGGKGSSYWQGFSEVWSAARELNQIVINACVRDNLPVIAFPPSAGVITQDRHIKHWDIRPIKAALSHGLIPVVYGDVVFDTNLGGTILSTEEFFLHLAKSLQPQHILIAGLEKGVYRDPYEPEAIIPLITPGNIHEILPSLSPSKAVDVTGGMLAKVEVMLSLVNDNPSLSVHIFSGVEPGNLQKVLTDENGQIGTIITHRHPS